MSESQWRTSTSAEQYRHHDYADFAQEFLQRNAAYRRDHAETQDRIEGAPVTIEAEEEGLAGRWGLCFPHSAGSRPARKSGALVTARSSRRRGDRNARHRGDPTSARI